MKYWVFQSNQVVGPYDRDQLASTPGFGAESLVCPEGRKGTQMGDWQRAGVVAELAETLLRMARVPAGAGVGGGSSYLPPEPTLRDLAVLGTLQEKVSLLENSLSSLHEELREREEEIAGLKTELSQKASESSDLQVKVGDLETKLGAAESMRDELAQTRLAQEGDAKTVVDLRSQLDAVRADLQSTVTRMEETQRKLRDDLSGEIDKVKRTAAGAPASARPSPAAAIPPVVEKAPAALPATGLHALKPAEPEPLPFAAPEPPGFGALAEPPAPGGLEAPPAPGGEAPPFELGSGATPAPVPLDAPPALDLSAAPEQAPPPFADGAAPPAGLDLPGNAAPAPNFGSMPTPLPSLAPNAPLFGPDTPSPTQTPAPGAEGVVDLMAPEAKPKKGKGMLVAVVLLAVAGGLAGAYQMGFLAPVLAKLGLAKPAPALAVTPKAPPPPAPKPEPAAPTPEVTQGQPDRAQAAIDFAKSYPIPRLGETLSQALEPTASGNGLVSPWNVKPSGDGSWEVSFYGEPGRLDYSFSVQLDAQQLRGLNAKSQAVLDGKAPSPPAAPLAEAKPRRPMKRKGRHSAAARAAEAKAATGGAAEEASQALSEDPLSAMLNEGASPEGQEKPARKPRRGRKPAPEAAPEEQAPEQPPAASQDESSAAPSEAASGDEASGDQAAGDEAPAKPARKRAKKPSRSKEELTLDQLLLPGVPKQ